MPTKPNSFAPKWKPKPIDTRTKEAKQRQKLYNHKWSKQRSYFLQDNPLCVMCQNQGTIKQASVVDHIIPHKGDLQLFWDISNWQSLCKRHHDSDKRKIELRGEGAEKKSTHAKT